MDRPGPDTAATSWLPSACRAIATRVPKVNPGAYGSMARTGVPSGAYTVTRLSTPMSLPTA